MPGQDGFTLREQMRVAFLVAHFRSPEVEAFDRFGAIGDSDRDFFVRGNHLRKANNQIIAGDLKVLDFFGCGNGLNIQAHSVKAQFLDRSKQRFEAQNGFGVNGPLFEVWSAESSSSDFAPSARALPNAECAEQSVGNLLRGEILRTG